MPLRENTAAKELGILRIGSLIACLLVLLGTLVNRFVVSI
jgi:hypothetical protein